MRTCIWPWRCSWRAAFGRAGLNTSGAGSSPRTGGAATRFTKPRWDGQDIGRRVLLLHAEQGLGDTLQFCRYAPHLAARHRVVMEVQRPLVGLLQRLPFVEQVVAQGDPLPPHDLQCPLMSLPRRSSPPSPRRSLRRCPISTPSRRASTSGASGWSLLEGLKVGRSLGGQPHARARSPAIASGRAPGCAGRDPGRRVRVAAEGSRRNRGAVPAGLDLHDGRRELTDLHETAALVSDPGPRHQRGHRGRPPGRRAGPAGLAAEPLRQLLALAAGARRQPLVSRPEAVTQSAPGDWDEVLARVRAALLERRDAASSASKSMTTKAGDQAFRVPQLLGNS